MEHHFVSSITPELARSLLPNRPDDSHKGSFGKALVIAGSTQFPGAANLAIQAALRSGAGLVYAAIPESIYLPLAASIPEAIWLVIPEKDGAITLEGQPDPRVGKRPAFSSEQDMDAILVGPGLGQADCTKDFLFSLLSHLPESAPDLPIVIDADALNILSRQPNWASLLPKQTILTPHEMEFSRLSGLPVDQIHQNRQDLAITYAQQWQHTLILKGANTLVVSPAGECRLLPFASSALAHGGTGDVLAGLLVGLLAQGLAL